MTPQATHLIGIDRVKKNSTWFLILGILLIITGAVAIGEAFVMTVFSMKFLGWLLLFAGIATVIHSFAKERGWGGFFLNLLTGVLYTVAGYIIISNPAASAAALTLIIAYLLIFEGLFRAIAAVANRYPHWGWVLFSGLVTMALGIMIQRGWPVSGLWVIGLYIGISMVLNGWSLVMLSLMVKNIADDVADAATADEKPAEA